MPAQSPFSRFKRLFRGDTEIFPVRVVRTTVTVDPASIAATTKARTTVAVSGLLTTDLVIVEPPSGLNDDLIVVGAGCASNGNLFIDIYNPTGGALDQGSGSWVVKYVRQL